MPTAGRDAVPSEHGPAAILEGEGWVAQGMNRRLEGRHGALARGTALGKRRAIDGGLARGTDKTDRLRAAVDGRRRSQGWRGRRSGGGEGAEGLGHHVGRAQDMDVVRIGEYHPPGAEEALQAAEEGVLAERVQLGGRAASRPCEGSQPSVPGAGLLAGRAVKGAS